MVSYYMCLWILKIVFGIHYILFPSVLCYIALALKLKATFPRFPCNYVSGFDFNSASQMHCDICEAESEQMSPGLDTGFEILRGRICRIHFYGAVMWI